MQKSEYFADVLGTAITKDYWKEVEPELIYDRLPFAELDYPRFIIDPN